MAQYDRFQQALIDAKVIDPAALDSAIQQQKSSGDPLFKVVSSTSGIDERRVAEVLSEVSLTLFVSAAEYEITQDLLNVIPKGIAIKNKIFPLAKDNGFLTLAMLDPFNFFVKDSIQSLTGLNVKPVVILYSEYNGLVETHYLSQEQENNESPVEENQSHESFDDLMGEFEDGDVQFVAAKDEAKGDGSVERLTEEAPILKLVDSIIQQSVIQKASDVFIEPLEHEVRVRYRIDGIIKEVDRVPKALLSPIVSRIKVISSLDISEHRVPQDGRFKTVIGGKREVDFRVSILPTIIGEKVCLRILDKESGALGIEKLGFEPESMARLTKVASQPHGMILVCGPTGSGKTTTLYSLLGHIDSPGENIITVEDPVEFEMRGINQVNVKPQLGLTFAASLRSILRQDPDVILIGEIRDGPTLDIGIKAALTGHLVLSSLHTTTAAGSIIRMTNMGIEPFLICSSLLAIVAQRLLRRVCPKCRELYTVPDEVVQDMEIDRHPIEGDKVQLYRAKGCPDCNNVGYRGRVGITEILLVTPKMKKLIMQDKGELEMKKLSRIEGMLTMREDGVRKALKGLTTLEEVIRITAPDDRFPTEEQQEEFLGGIQ